MNATAAALLGLLHEGPMSGGQLVTAAKERFGAFFSVTRSQVYRELPALAVAGLLERGEQGPRSSQKYVLTPLGKRAFRAWVAAGRGADVQGEHVEPPGGQDLGDAGDRVGRLDDVEPQHRRARGYWWHTAPSDRPARRSRARARNFATLASLMSS